MSNRTIAIRQVDPSPDGLELFAYWDEDAGIYCAFDATRADASKDAAALVEDLADLEDGRRPRWSPEQACPACGMDHTVSGREEGACQCDTERQDLFQRVRLNSALVDEMQRAAKSIPPPPVSAEQHELCAKLGWRPSGAMGWGHVGIGAMMFTESQMRAIAVMQAQHIGLQNVARLKGGAR